MSDSHDARRNRREQLLRSFRDRETREGYAEGFLHTWLATQIATVRMQRGLTQKKVAELMGTQQPGVARMERDGYGKWSFATLTKLAQTLDCRLKVSLETYGTLVDEALAFGPPEVLQRPAFEEDPVFNLDALAPELQESGPLGEMRRKLRRWFDADAPTDQLMKWLQGYDLPAVGDEEPPAYWITSAAEAFTDSEETHLLTRRIRVCLERCAEADPAGVRKPEVLKTNVFDLVRRRPRPRDYREGLDDNRTYLSKQHARLTQTRPGLSLLDAIIANQDSTHFSKLWHTHLEEADEQSPYRDFSIGLRGMARIPSEPNPHEVTYGSSLTFSAVRKRKMEPQRFVTSLSHAFTDLWREFLPKSPMFADDTWRHVLGDGLPEIVLKAFTLSMPQHFKVRQPYNDAMDFREYEMVMQLSATV